MDTLLLPQNLRSQLKSPLGLLIRGSVDETMVKLREFVDSMKPKKIISVGDVVSENMLKKGLKVDVFIVDNKSMRRPVKPLHFKASKNLTLINPAGTITKEAWRIIGEAINSGELTKVLVDGEEDLLTIVAVLLAPENSIVVYGQPDEGIVVVKVDEKSKKIMREILDKMERIS
ncbi:MAG: GTP-dependent dephospho-CoA kinase family protein [Candidatus Bathyarchaeota archaeon]|nr:GTP-dependent dephospho-CoA kinase family protein [Candidatus Bathyarchaeota archaeon]